MIKRTPTGLRLGKAGCILETLSDYGEVPLRIREQILNQRSNAQLNRWFSLARPVSRIDAFTNRI
ncbi:MAG: hypothetical protein V8Q27_04320 [Eubacteriales bacterium]